MKLVFPILYWTIGQLIRWVFRIEVSGLEDLPKSGALLCSNHASDWDPVLIGAALPMDYHLHIMAKKELFDKKWLAWLITKLGAFPVNREGADIKAIKTAMQVLEHGDNLLIFIEGTTIRNGVGYHDGLPPHAHTGAVMIGARAGAQLVPVFADGEKKMFRKTRIIFGEPITPVFSSRRGTPEEMQKIADDVLEKAYALGGQAVGGKPLCK